MSLDNQKMRYGDAVAISKKYNVSRSYVSIVRKKMLNGSHVYSPLGKLIVKELKKLNK